VVGSGKVKIEVNQTYPLAEVALRASRPRSTQAYRIDHPAALMERLRARLVALRYMLATAWPIVLITAIGLVVAYQFVAPEPPRASRSAPAAKPAPTTPMRSAMPRCWPAKGITLEVMTSAGSHQNLERSKKAKPTSLSCRGALLPGPDDDETNPVPCVRSAASPTSRCGCSIAASSGSTSCISSPAARRRR
jgi:hypothetical protein